MRPTGRTVLLIGAGAPFSLLLVLMDETLWPAGLIYAAAVLGLMAADYAVSPRGRAVAATVSALPSVPIGEPLVFDVAIDAGGNGAGNGEVILDLGGPVAAPGATPFTFAPAATASVTARPSRRGVVALEALWLSWQGPLGLARQVRRFTPSVSVPVIPNTRRIRGEAVRLRQRHSFYGIKTQPERGEGTAFDSMREFVHGMDPRTIDWKHSARHLKLVSKEFEAERNHQIILALDTGHLMSEPLRGMARLDHATSAALMLAYVSLRHGDRIGLYSFDAQPGLFLDPLTRMHDFPKLQERTARLAYSSSETNYTLGLTRLGARLRRRSLIVLFTEFVDTVTAELMIENVAQLARRHLVLFVSMGDPELKERADAPPFEIGDVAGAVVAHSLSQERDTVYERLRRMGVQCVEAREGELANDVVNRYLDVKRREMI